MNDAERDAWLREALRHAPDADAVPPTGVSEAILAKARAQAQGGAPARTRPARGSAANGLAAFWDWLARPPVAAGFASVMAATLVGLMWWDRPMDEAMPRAPALTAERSGAPRLASPAPTTAEAPPPAIEAAKSRPPIESKASAKAAADDASDLQRRHGSALKPSPVIDAKSEPAASPQKRKPDQLAKERAPVADAKNETPAPFPVAPATREAQAAGSLEGAATEVAKKADESRRSRAVDAVGPAAPPDVATAPAAAPAARAAKIVTRRASAPMITAAAVSVGWCIPRSIRDQATQAGSARTSAQSTSRTAVLWTREASRIRRPP